MDNGGQTVKFFRGAAIFVGLITYTKPCAAPLKRFAMTLVVFTLFLKFM